MTIREIQRELQHTLTPVVGDAEARAMSLVVIEDIKGYKAVDVAVNGDRTLLDDTVARMRGVAARVVAGEPLQYALGTARFMGRDFKVTPDVLIPRPETAALVDMIADDAGARADLRALDIGTGSGCIAVTLALILRFPDVTAMDISLPALQVARENATRYNAKVDFIEGDILGESNLSGRTFDIIVSNPPYVLESEKTEMDPRVYAHEPASALFVPDADPLLYYRAIAHCGRTMLTSGGKLYLEINPLCVRGLGDLLSSKGYRDVHALRDFRGVYRYITATR